MKNNDYLIPGIAAISVAILFPVSWVYELAFNLSSVTDYQYVFELRVSSFLFLLVGLLSIYIYYYFMKLLHDHHNYKRADFSLIAMMVFLFIYYIGFFILDLISIWFGPLLNNTATSLLFAVSIILFGIIDLLIAVTVLMANKELPEQFKVFAILNLVMGVFELTFVLSPLVLILLPVVTILIALIFLKKPEMIEIV